MRSDSLLHLLRQDVYGHRNATLDMAINADCTTPSLAEAAIKCLQNFNGIARTDCAISKVNNDGRPERSLQDCACGLDSEKPARGSPRRFEDD